MSALRGPLRMDDVSVVPCRLRTHGLVSPCRRTLKRPGYSVRQHIHDRQLDPPDTVVVGNGIRALLLQPFCGDCQPTDIYVVSARTVVVLSYVLGTSFPGDRDAQDRLNMAILSTFAWK
jgi:hypothetical protein